MHGCRRECLKESIKQVCMNAYASVAWVASCTNQAQPLALNMTEMDAASHTWSCCGWEACMRTWTPSVDSRLMTWCSPMNRQGLACRPAFQAQAQALSPDTDLYALIMCRYMVVLRLGGVHADVGTECRQPLNDLVQPHVTTSPCVQIRLVSPRQSRPIYQVDPHVQVHGGVAAGGRVCRYGH